MNKDNSKKGFKAPEGYFEGFTDRLLDKMSDIGSDQEGSLLPKKDGFRAPDGYFDTLNKNIQNKLNEEVPKVIALKPRRNYFYYAAASFAVIIGVTLAVQTAITDNPTIEGLAGNAIEDYFENVDLGLSTYEIAEVIPIDDLEISDVLDSAFEEEHILDYLDSSIDNIEELNLTDYEY